MRLTFAGPLHASVKNYAQNDCNNKQPRKKNVAKPLIQTDTSVMDFLIMCSVCALNVHPSICSVCETQF